MQRKEQYFAHKEVTIEATPTDTETTVTQEKHNDKKLSHHGSGKFNTRLIFRWGSDNLAAANQIDKLVADGADIIDLGAESSRLEVML